MVEAEPKLIAALKDANDIRNEIKGYYDDAYTKKWFADENSDMVELTEPEYDFLLKSVETATPPTRSRKLINAIYDLFELE
jgi:hypothetical protein